MEKVRIERSIVALLVVASIGLSFVSISEGWEFWMPPVKKPGTLYMRRIPKQLRGRNDVSACCSIPDYDII